jgi:hypothetical protein
MSASAALLRIDEALDYLAEVVAAQKTAPEPDFDRLLVAYGEARRELAKSFRELASSLLVRASERLDQACADIQRRMRKSFSDLVPERLLEVRGYASVHAVLLEYLAGHVAQPVPASRLRVLVGDQVHTERRVRELRDLGFAITWKKVAGEDQYVLQSDRPNLDVGARSQLALRIRADKRLSRAQRASLLELTT